MLFFTLIFEFFDGGFQHIDTLTARELMLLRTSVLSVSTLSGTHADTCGQNRYNLSFSV